MIHLDNGNCEYLYLPDDPNSKKAKGKVKRKGAYAFVIYTAKKGKSKGRVFYCFCEKEKEREDWMIEISQFCFAPDSIERQASSLNFEVSRSLVSATSELDTIPNSQVQPLHDPRSNRTKGPPGKRQPGGSLRKGPDRKPPARKGPSPSEVQRNNNSIVRDNIEDTSSSEDIIQVTGDVYRITMAIADLEGNLDSFMQSVNNENIFNENSPPNDFDLPPEDDVDLPPIDDMQLPSDNDNKNTGNTNRTRAPSDFIPLPDNVTEPDSITNAQQLPNFFKRKGKERPISFIDQNDGVEVIDLRFL
eukprot:TRINITY_DN1953_c0_g1_i1.p1 TRINITY_DN1953_c0_g1~~TRINITY_DN1953_c0_g1_i1.p1  ORF type:complete len:303 (+),score=78.00 TRINITY_DN1953_c0_g1_i1:581-1489(+)